MKKVPSKGLTEVECAVEPRQVGRIDRVVQELTGLSRSGVNGLFDADCVSHNGEACPVAGAPVEVGDKVTVRYDVHRRYKPRPRVPDQRNYRLVHEDDELIVVDKAAGVLTVPTDHAERNTLLETINRHLERKRRHAEAIPIHRLDRGTSGLLVFAKTAHAAKILQEQFRVHSPEREYVALVAGTVTPSVGTFSARLGSTKSLQRYTTDDPTEGEHATTHYEVVQSLKGTTFVRVRLETGRRHQIRIHFSDAGHPVLGETRYDVAAGRHPGWKARRLALHAGRLGFVHPRTEETVRFESPLPIEFERFLGTVS